MIGGNVAYVLSTAPPRRGTSLSYLRAQLVDLSTGDEICQREFGFQAPSNYVADSSFALAGSDRRLASCGGDLDGRCFLLDPLNDGQDVMIQSGGPELKLHSSLVSHDGHWFLIGTE